METLMVDRVQSSLRLFMPRNAVFLCERLCAEFPAEINLQLLATCYMRNNQAYSAYHILKGMKLPQSRYLFATSCFHMNLLREAEAALCPANEPNSEVPSGAAGHYLLGLIYRHTGREVAAADQFMQALALDPLLWAAFEELCMLGVADEANEFFNDAAALRIQQQYLSELSSQKFNSGSESQGPPSNVASGIGDTSPRKLKQLHANNSSEIPGYPHGPAAAALQTVNCAHSNVAPYDTPSPTVTKLSGIAPPPLCRNAQVNLSTVGGDPRTKSKVNAANQAPRRKYVDEAKLRKVSERLLFSESGRRKSTRLSREATTDSNPYISQLGGNGTWNSSAKWLGGYPSSSSKMISASLRSTTARKGQPWLAESFDEGRRHGAFDDTWSDNIATTSATLTVADGRCFEQDKTAGSWHCDSMTSGIRDLLGLLQTLGEGYRLSCLYRCQAALEVYRKLSENQFNTGWVLSQVAKAHFELVNYSEANCSFELAHRISPYTLEGMDVYSTVLYHLKDEMKLSYLAQELISIDRLSPQAWCAVGNCYSLQKDHETALKNFQRAVQLDSRFAYAHTLCGHEYVALEDYENSIKSFQSALQVDERHYNSWYGLGVVYLRQEKFEFAEHHFRKAYHINPHSSVLMCYLGMALYSLKRNVEALEMMEKAILADKKNPLPIYQKAQILVNFGRFDEALEELENLKEHTPQESSVYALMGKIYKQLNVHDKAMFYFGLALDLKPPPADVAVIKSAMEKLFLPDEMDDL